MSFAPADPSSSATPPAPRPRKPTPEEVAAGVLASSLDGNCSTDFYRAASSNTELSDAVRRLCTVLAIVIARTPRNEVTAMRFAVAKVAREVLGGGTKSINDVLARWFAADDTALFTRKADLLTRVFSTKRLDHTVRDLAWCHLSKSCPLNAKAIGIAEAWVNKLVTERPTETTFNSKIDVWWPNFEAEATPDAK